MYKKQEGKILSILNVKIKQIIVMVILFFTMLVLKLDDFLIMSLFPVYVLKMYFR